MLLLGACSGESSLEGARIGGPQGGSALLPRTVLFAPEEFSSPTISPDGQKLAFLAPDPTTGVENVWIAPIRDLSKAQPITDQKTHDIKKYQWATDRYVLYLQDTGGDENWRLYQVDVASTQVRELTEEFPPGVQTRILGSSATDVLVGVNHRDPRFHDLYRIDLASGERTLVWQNAGFSSYEVDSETSNVRVALRPEADGSVSVLERRDPAAGFEPAFEIPYADTQTTQVLGSDPARRTLYLADSRGAEEGSAGTAALVELNLDTKATRVLLRDEQADITEIVRHPGDGHLEAAIATYDRKRVYILDREFGVRLDAITKAIRSHEKMAAGGAEEQLEVTIVSRSHDDALWIVKSVASDHPEKYFLFDRTTGQTSELGGASRALAPSRMAKAAAVVIPSRDGLPLVSYLTLPTRGSGSAKNPMVVLVHGGPWERDDGTFHRSRQWLADRGYASLAVNFRSSVGFGKKLVNAGDREWGAKMNDDLVDAVGWVVQKGLADPRRVALMGASYGGYAAVTGLAVSPNTFACGIDVVGPTNLPRFFTTMPAYWEGQVDNTALRVGDHRTAAGQAFLAARSPVTFVDKIRRPVLIAHGVNDSRVNVEESDELATAMKGRGLDVTYAKYADEGHGFQRTENRVAFAVLVESFLSKCLKGPQQPLEEEELTRSSMELKLGGEKYPEIDAALKARDRAATPSTRENNP
jgi:dipeptidyl aminopeptidase/acylaminoacyl peptidase